MSAKTSKKNTKNTDTNIAESKKLISELEDFKKNTNDIIESKTLIKEIDELDELEKINLSIDSSVDDLLVSKPKVVDNRKKNIPIRQQIFKNAKPDIQSKLIDETSDIYDIIHSDNLPKNYGTRWSDDDKKKLIELLKQNQDKEINYTDIANKLGRSEGGVKGEVKKMILTRYLNGEEPDYISTDLNIQYKFVKMLIKSYIDTEIDSDITSLEKENKFLKLKMENIELRKSIAKIYSNK